MSCLVVTSEKNGSLLKVVLNRPLKKNALSVALLKELIALLQSLDAKVRIVTFQGAGGFFSSGLDLEDGVANDPLAGPKLVKELLETLLFLPQVSIALVEGGAYAGGLGIVSACTLAIASPSAKFSLPEVRRGLIPSLVTVILKRQLPLRFLSELVVAGEPITGVRAHAIGLVNEVVMHEEFDAILKRYTEEILKGAPGAIKKFKEILFDRATLAREFEAALLALEEARLSGEAKEGINAFLEKRPPSWRV